jgi:hypothetical protein
MDAMNDRDPEAYAVVDEALRTYPLQPAPLGIMHAVMRRVEVSAPLPRFRLHWLDVALSFFLPGMVGLIYAIMRLSLLPPAFMPLLQNRLIVFWQQLSITLWPLDPVIFLGILLIGSLLSFVAVGVFVRTRHTWSRIAF